MERGQPPAPAEAGRSEAGEDLPEPAQDDGAHHEVGWRRTGESMLQQKFIKYIEYLKMMLEKMKERSIDNFMGRVLVKLVEQQKTDKTDTRDVESEIFKEYKTKAENISKEFYFKSRKIGLKEFWKGQFEKYQGISKLEEEGSEYDGAKFTADLIRKYL